MTTPVQGSPEPTASATHDRPGQAPTGDLGVRKRRIVVGIIGCLGATLVLAVLVFWAVVAVGRRLSQEPPRAREAVLKLPSAEQQQQAVEAVTRCVKGWRDGDYATVYGLMSTRAAVREGKTEDGFASDMREKRELSFFNEDLGEPKGLVVLEGASVVRVTAVVQRTVTEAGQAEIEAGEWSPWREKELVPVAYELGGFDWAAIMVKEEGEWRCLTVPGECARDELAAGAPGRTGDPDARIDKEDNG